MAEPPATVVARVAFGAFRRLAWIGVTPARVRAMRAYRIRRHHSLRLTHVGIQLGLSLAGLALFAVPAYFLLRGKPWAWTLSAVLLAAGTLSLLVGDVWARAAGACDAVELALLLTPSAVRYVRPT